MTFMTLLLLLKEKIIIKMVFIILLNELPIFYTNKNFKAKKMLRKIINEMKCFHFTDGIVYDTKIQDCCYNNKSDRNYISRVELTTVPHNFINSVERHLYTFSILKIKNNLNKK